MLRQLEYFITVAQCLNFTRAAERLFMAQSALSQQISSLESRVGVPLLIRDKRSVRLTTAGEIFLQDAIDIVKRYNEALERARRAAGGLAGSMQIGFLGPSVRAFLPYLVRKFRTAYPEVALKLEEYDHGPLIEALKLGKVDLAFTLNIGLQGVPGVEWRTIYTEPDTVVLRHDHPKAKYSAIDLRLLANENFIVMDRTVSPQGFDRAIHLCTKAGFSPRIVSQTRFIQTILFLVEAGVGISILPRCFESYASSELRFISIIDEEAVHEVVVAWNTSNTNPIISRFLKTMQTEGLIELSPK
ncbi:MAG: LysR family transcriptional regulator [Moorellaceae bacterium]